MPTYDYQCHACDHKFEHFQGINAPVLKKCPECGKNKLQRLIGAGAAVVFKGSGFYQTDYRSDSYKQKAAAEGKSSDAGASSGATSGDSKSGGESKGASDGKPAAASAAAKPAPPAKSPKKGE
jgi:putative FmdB family regulatory protein